MRWFQKRSGSSIVITMLAIAAMLATPANAACPPVVRATDDVPHEGQLSIVVSTVTGT